MYCPYFLKDCHPATEDKERTKKAAAAKGKSGEQREGTKAGHR